MTNDHLFAIQSFRFTLEHIMGEYVRECARKKPRKSQLDRHEKVMKKAFESMSKDLIYSCPFTFGPTPLVDGVMKEKAKMDEPADFAIARFILKHRYLNTPPV